jgi:hypothetical protein
MLATGGQQTSYYQLWHTYIHHSQRLAISAVAADISKSLLDLPVTWVQRLDAGDHSQLSSTGCYWIYLIWLQATAWHLVTRSWYMQAMT